MTLSHLLEESREEFFANHGHVISTGNPVNFAEIGKSLESLIKKAYAQGVEDADNETRAAFKEISQSITSEPSPEK